MKNIFFIVDFFLVGSEYKSTKKVNQENRTSSYFRLIRHNIYYIMSLFAFDMPIEAGQATRLGSPAWIMNSITVSFALQQKVNQN